jgi:hypothetical protein
MPIFKQHNSSCYFIHIPRTGGRYISSLFENTHNIDCSYHKINKQRIREVDSTHLHYPLYNYFLEVSNIPHITVVRNPYDKFVSCLNNMHSIHSLEYNKLLTDENSFLEFVHQEIEITSFHNNWFLPQYKFLSPKTSFWKYEWGFGQNFKRWVFEKTGIILNINEDVVYEKFGGETNLKYKLDDRIKTYVKNFYSIDYKKFDY